MQKLISKPMRVEPHGQRTIKHEGGIVRRNEPCVCGSGKKFKNCCRRAGEKNMGNLDLSAVEPDKEDPEAITDASSEQEGVIKLDVLWDTNTQFCTVKFDNTQWKSWPFIVAVLEMAVRQAKETEQIIQAQVAQQHAIAEMQRNAAAQGQAVNIRKKLVH
jgi:uncharacterized protein YecA (UPF0149 family)